MAHHHKSEKNRTTPKKRSCCICGKMEWEHKLKREPPVSGPFVHPGDCRDKKKADDKEGKL